MLVSHRSIYSWLRKNTPLYKWGKLTFDFGFCQFVHMLKSDSANLNHGFIASGIQSVTVKTLIPKKSSSSEIEKTAERIAKYCIIEYLELPILILLCFHFLRIICTQAILCTTLSALKNIFKSVGILSQLLFS